MILVACVHVDVRVMPRISLRPSPVGVSLAPPARVSSGKFQSEPHPAPKLKIYSRSTRMGKLRQLGTSARSLYNLLACSVRAAGVRAVALRIK